MSLTEDERLRGELALELQQMGSPCPAPPKVKIQSALLLCGLVYFVLMMYTILRNICYIRIE